jgi:long-chain acyl-CoA synthetase
VTATATASADLISMPELLARNVLKFGAKAAYREKEFGIWQSWTWSEAAEQIEALALGLLKLGAAKGDHIAIAGRNRPYLYWTMLAAQSIGAVPVPIYQDSVGEELAVTHVFLLPVIKSKLIRSLISKMT